MLQEMFDRKQKKLYMFLVDLEMFGGMPREVIRWAFRKKGHDYKLVLAVMQLFDGMRTKVRVWNGVSKAFEVKVGLHQGSVLSSLLFVIVVHDMCVERLWKDCYLKFFLYE